MAHHIDYDPMRGKITINDSDLIHAATYGKGFAANITPIMEHGRPALQVTFYPETLTIHAPQRPAAAATDDDAPSAWPCPWHTSYVDTCHLCDTAKRGHDADPPIIY